MLKPVGFWSYTRSTEAMSRGKLSEMRVRVAMELEVLIGRSAPVQIFQDAASIPFGTEWDAQINAALRQAHFFIPILTPDFLQSEWCCREVMLFHEREKALGRADLIFPVHYVDVGDTHPERPGDCHDPRVWELLRRRQWVDYRQERLKSADSEEVGRKISDICLAIRAALRSGPATGAGDRQRQAVAQDTAQQPQPDRAEGPPLPPRGTQGTRSPRGPGWRRALTPQGIGVLGGVAALSIAGGILLLRPGGEPPRDNGGGAARAGAPGSAAAPGYPVPVGQAFRDCADCPEMVVVPAGQFVMGTPNAERDRRVDEGPQRGVRLAAPLAVGRAPVTVRQYRAFATATGRSDPGQCVTITLPGGRWDRVPGRGWQSPGFPQTDDDPVVCVSWEDATAFAQWLAARTGKPYRLPTEAEWEYAARAGTTTAWWWGVDDTAQCKSANAADQTTLREVPGITAAQAARCDDGYAYTSPVGRFAANAFGLHDLVGNVQQWVLDCYQDSYTWAPSDASQTMPAAECSRRVIRGGAWTFSPQNLRVGSRVAHAANGRFGLVGFRVARGAP